MLYFENDYCEGAHEEILKKLVETNLEKTSGYGTDPYCASAREKIRAACSCPEADVFFVSGGTQANVIVIAAMLRRYEGVVAAVTGHIHGHEAGKPWNIQGIKCWRAADGWKTFGRRSAGVSGDLLCRRKSRAHDLPRHGVYLLPH